MFIQLISIEEVLPIRHQVMWPEKSVDFVKVDGDDTARHYGCYCEDKLVSVISIFMDGRIAQFRKFASLVEYQGQGFGTTLLNHVLNDLRHQACPQIWCNARIEKTAFYQKFGLVVVGESFDKNGKTYVKMVCNFEL